MEKGLVLASGQPGEQQERPKGEQHLAARHVMAAVVAYWRSNCGAAWALKYWE